MTQLQALLEKYATHPLYAPGLIVVTLSLIHI